MANRYKSVALLRDEAKGYMNGNYGRAIGVLLLFALFSYVVNMVLASFDEILKVLFVNAGIISNTGMLALEIIYYVINIALSIMLAVLTIGMNLFYLKIGCKVRPAAVDLFAGFRENFPRSLKIAFGVEGPFLLALSPGMVAWAYYNDTNNIMSLYVSIVCLVVGGIIAIFYSISFQMSFFIMHDFADYSASEVLKACWKKMKGNRARLLGLELSFIPYILLVVLTLGIGMLWVYPLMIEARAQFYLDLMNPKKISGEWERTV